MHIVRINVWDEPHATNGVFDLDFAEHLLAMLCFELLELLTFFGDLCRERLFQVLLSGVLPGTERNRRTDLMTRSISAAGGNSMRIRTVAGRRTRRLRIESEEAISERRAEGDGRRWERMGEDGRGLGEGQDEAASRPQK